MKNILLYIMAFAITSIVISCTDSNENESSDNNLASYNELEKVNWLIGEWANHSDNGVFTETWTRENDSLLVGVSFFIVGADTVFSENITLEQHGSELFYIPVISEQNDGQPVKFKLTSSNEMKFIFENPSHDFPQQISYTKISNDSLVAEISGKMQGEPHSEIFPMKKMK